MKQFLLLLISAASCRAFRAPAMALGIGAPRVQSALSVIGGKLPPPLYFSKLQPVVAPVLNVIGQTAIQGMMAARQVAEEPEIRLAVGTKLFARPLLNVASRVTKKMRTVFGSDNNECFLTLDGPRYADSLGDLLLLNGALRCATSAYPTGSPTIPTVLPAMAKLSYIAFVASAASSVKDRVFARQPHLVDKFTSLFIWGTASLAATDVLSSSTKLSISKTLAIGGFSGTLISLFAKDLSSNIFGGATVILNDRFKPGDTVSFKLSGTEFTGEIKSIGLTQTVMRNTKDSKLTYIPNGLLAQAPVTRIGREDIKY